jgi:hypothetical protein
MAHLRMMRHKTSDSRFEIRERRIDGHRALHAAATFAPAEVLLRFSARAAFAAPAVHTIQVNEWDHILLDPDFLEFTNHSCSPNVIFDVSRNVVEAVRTIHPGDEILYFYPSTEVSMAQPFACGCGSPDCLRVIRGAEHLDASVLERYFLADHVQSMLADRVGIAGESAA